MLIIPHPTPSRFRKNVHPCLHHQFGVVVVQLPAPQQLLEGVDDLLTPTDHVSDIVPGIVPQTNLQWKCLENISTHLLLLLLHLGLFV